MKKSVLLLVCILCIVGWTAMAAASEGVAGGITESMYEQHQGLHDMYAIRTGFALLGDVGILPEGSPDYAACLECQLEQGMLPGPYPELSEMLSLFDTAMETMLYAAGVQNQYGTDNALNPAMQEDEPIIHYAISMLQAVAGDAVGGETLVPLVFLDTAGKSVDGKVYMLNCVWNEEMGSAWLCADDALTYEMLQTVTAAGEDAARDNAYIQPWLDAYAGVNGDAQAGTGQVLVLGSGAVNVRGEPNADAAIVGKAKTGQTYASQGADPGTGWYAITLENGASGYISPKMVEYTAGMGAEADADEPVAQKEDSGDGLSAPAQWVEDYADVWNQYHAETVAVRTQPSSMGEGIWQHAAVNVDDQAFIALQGYEDGELTMISTHYEPQGGQATPEGLALFARVAAEMLGRINLDMTRTEIEALYAEFEACATEAYEDQVFATREVGGKSVFFVAPQQGDTLVTAFVMQ